MIAVYQKEKEDIATIHSKEKEDIINTHLKNIEEMKLKQELELKKETIANNKTKTDNEANKRFEDLQNEFKSKTIFKGENDMLKAFPKEKEEMIAVYQKEKEDIATIHSKEKEDIATVHSKEKEDIINTHLKNIEEMKLKQELKLKKMEETIANNKTKTDNEANKRFEELQNKFNIIKTLKKKDMIKRIAIIWK